MIDLEPFTKVLCRDRENNYWSPDILLQVVKPTKTNPMKYKCASKWWLECIPYEENKHLCFKVGNPYQLFDLVRYQSGDSKIWHKGIIIEEPISNDLLSIAHIETPELIRTEHVKIFKRNTYALP